MNQPLKKLRKMTIIDSGKFLLPQGSPYFAQGSPYFAQGCLYPQDWRLLFWKKQCIIPIFHLAHSKKQADFLLLYTQKPHILTFSIFQL